MHDVCRDAILPGGTPGQLDALARDVLDRRGATSNFLGYGGFPAVLCASVNAEIVHGIPGPRVLEEGDVVSIDCGAVVEGWHGDAAFPTTVGEGSAPARVLAGAGRRSTVARLDEGVAGRTPRAPGSTGGGGV